MDKLIYTFGCHNPNLLQTKSAWKQNGLGGPLSRWHRKYVCLYISETRMYTRRVPFVAPCNKEELWQSGTSTDYFIACCIRFFFNLRFACLLVMRLSHLFNIHIWMKYSSHLLGRKSCQKIRYQNIQSLCSVWICRWITCLIQVSKVVVVLLR